jgi:hypothetical protein
MLTPCLRPPVSHSLEHHLKQERRMRPKQKTDYQQTNLVFSKKDLWEKFPEPNRVRCRELIVQMLRAVLMPTQPERNHEREN